MKRARVVRTSEPAYGGLAAHRFGERNLVEGLLQRHAKQRVECREQSCHKVGACFADASSLCQQLAHPSAHQGIREQLQRAIVEFTQQDCRAQAAKFFNTQQMIA
jgi:hypothetical protein